MAEPSPEPVRLPERFRTENQMTAVYARFALNRDNLNPQKKDIPETAENQLTNLNETVTKAGTASTMERRNVGYSKEQWAGMMVEGFSKQGNAQLVNKLKQRRIGNMDFSTPNSELFLSAYQKYFADDGQGIQVEVIIKDEKQYIPARLNQFVEDILAAYPNKAELRGDIQAIEWFSGMFGGESKKIIRSILETKLILDKPEEKTNLVKDANEKASRNGDETTRVNWVDGNNKEEERQLQFLWGNSDGVERRTVDRSTHPTTRPDDHRPKPSKELTHELAQRDTEAFKQSAFALLRQRYPLVAQVWDTMVKADRISEKNLLFDPSRWDGYSDNVKHEIMIGLQPSPKDIKYRIFEDQRLSYQDEVIYKLSHEISHSLIDWILENKSDNRVANLIDEFITMREKDKTRGFSSLGSAPYYQGKGPRSQASEDAGELFNMYLQDPAYLRRYLDFISNPSHKNEIQNVGVVSITSDTAQNVYSVVESVLQKYIAKEPSEQTPLPDRPQSLEEMFGQVVGPVNENHQWFIKGKPQQIELIQDTADQYISKTTKPFFIIEKFDPLTKEFRLLTNKEVVPYAWDLGKGLAHENQRFINGETATHNDSSLFGLAAASADTPADQAELYKQLAGNILQIHKMKPETLLLWLNGQNEPQEGNINSLSIFFQNDHIFREGKNPELRPEKERLLSYSEPLKLKLQTPEDGVNFLKMWENRIVELNDTLQNNKLQPHHLRWMEFLSHSVDVAEMMKTIQAKEPKNDFEIKIIEQPKDIEDLIQIIDKQSDKPIIINIEKPYEEKDVIDLRHAVDRLNLTDALKRKKIDDNTEISGLIPLPGISNENEQYYYFNIVQLKPQDEGKTYVSGLVMKDKTGNLIPVGHVDYSLLKDQPHEAMACMSEMQEIVKNGSDKFPKFFIDFYKHFCKDENLDVAVRIDERFKGKNLGKYLWYLTLAQADSDNIYNLHIGGDATADKKTFGDSFYKHLGAQTILYASESLVLDEKSWKFIESGRIVINEKLFAPTFLTDMQIENLKRLF